MGIRTRVVLGTIVVFGVLQLWTLAVRMSIIGPQIGALEFLIIQAMQPLNLPLRLYKCIILSFICG